MMQLWLFKLKKIFVLLWVHIIEFQLRIYKYDLINLKRLRK